MVQATLIKSFSVKLSLILDNYINKQNWWFGKHLDCLLVHFRILLSLLDRNIMHYFYNWYSQSEAWERKVFKELKLSTSKWRQIFYVYTYVVPCLRHWAIHLWKDFLIKTSTEINTINICYISNEYIRISKT